MKYKQRETIKTRRILSGRASLFVSSNGEWLQEYEMVFLSLEKDFYSNSYSFFLRAENIADGNSDIGCIFEEEIIFPFEVERRDGYFMHFPTEEFHVGFAFIDESTALKFCRELEDINFVEMRNLEQQTKNLRRSKISKTHHDKEKYSEEKYLKKSSGKSDKNKSGTLSSLRESRSQSIQKSQPTIEIKSIKSDYLVGYENKSIVSYGSEESVTYSENATNYKNSNPAKNDAISLQSGFSSVSTTRKAKNLPPPFDCESIDSKVDDETKHSKSDIKSYFKNLFNPQKTVFKLKSKPENPLKSLTNSNPLPPPPTANKSSTAGSKPPPPPPLITQSTTQPQPPPFNQQATGAPSPRSGGAPPPPPPIINTKPQLTLNNPKPSSKKPPPVDAHSALLDSIRSHSKKGLNKVETTNKSEKMFEKNSKPSGTNQPSLNGSKPGSVSTRKKNPIEDQLNSVLSNFVMPTKK